MLSIITLFTKLKFQRTTNKRLRLPNVVPKGNYQKEHEVHSDERSSVCSGPRDTVRDSCGEGKHSCGQISKRRSKRKGQIEGLSSAKSNLGPLRAARNGGFAEAAHGAHAGLVIAAVWDTIWIGWEWAREVRGPCLLHGPSVTHVC